MNAEPQPFGVDVDGFVIQLQPSELRAVAAGMGGNLGGTLIGLASAVRALPTNDRAPLWELAVRHYARHKPLEQAAGEIGMDVIHGRALLAAFTQALAN
jgi:hypothetical protein